MIELDSIHSLTDFKRNTPQFMEKMKETHSPLVLTVNGRAELVVLDTDSFQELLNKVEYAETVQAIKEGMASFERGEKQTGKRGFK